MPNTPNPHKKNPKTCLPDHSNRQIMWSFINSFIGIYLIAITSQLFDLNVIDHLFLVGSFGASAVLLFGTPRIAYAQPRNLIGGHLISAIVGVTIYQYIPLDLAITSALAVSLSIVLMQLSSTVHPPGGATALIAVIGSNEIHNLGFMYVLSPIAIGVFFLLITALLLNNISKDPLRKYPKKWF